MNICANCKFCHLKKGLRSCTRDAGPAVVDPVTGYREFERDPRDCRQERESILPWRCGKSGRHWKHRDAE